MNASTPPGPQATPEPDDQSPPWHQRGKPSMPRAGSGPGARGIFSSAWWRGLAGRVRWPFRRRRRGPERPAPPRPEGLPDLLDTDEPEETFRFQTPAKGDGYHFEVSVRCSWCVQATAYPPHRKRRTQEIRNLVDEQRPVVRDRIQDTVRRIARYYPPYRPAEAEHAIGDELSACLSEGDLRVKVQVRVDVCDPVREDLRQVWKKRLVEDAEGESQKTSVQLVGELQDLWRELLLDGLQDIGEIQTAKTAWIAPYALALAQDPQESAAEYLRKMIAHRVDHAESLLTELGELVVDQRVEAIEFAFGSDSALRAVLKLLGVPVPDRGLGSARNDDSNASAASSNGNSSRTSDPAGGNHA
jgi:hypothetical protein